jgi:ribosome biogenesis GTPase / thiamine phosphate phosphatase
LEGLIYRSTGSWYEVRTADNRLYSCRLKGKFKIKGLKVTNPIAVGDNVVFEVEPGNENQGVIYEIVPRKNYLIRKSVHKTEHAHLLASNLDYLIFIFTLHSPRTSLGFLDRFLVSAETFRIPVLIIMNKIDLCDEEELETLDALAYLYTSLGYECMQTSAEENIGLDTLKSKIANKTVLISGHSGVGKSTLLNALDPELDLPTNEISDFASKGVHTTTFAEMFNFGDNTRIIDSPGIKELGLMEVKEAELAHYFPEFRALLGQCKYHNCIHINEPKCIVKENVENRKISSSRYQSYLSMYENDDNRR